MTGLSQPAKPIAWAAWLVLGACSGGVMAMAAYLLTAPSVGPPSTFWWEDKVYHVIAFAALTGPGVLALPRRHLWFWLAHIAFLSLGTEIVQGVMGEGREASVADFAANAVGITVATVVGLAIRGFVVGRNSRG